MYQDSALDVIFQLNYRLQNTDHIVSRKPNTGAPSRPSLTSGGVGGAEQAASQIGFMFLNIKRNLLYILIQAPAAPWHFDISLIYPEDSIDSNLFWYRHASYSSNICEILL